MCTQKKCVSIFKKIKFLIEIMESEFLLKSDSKIRARPFLALFIENLDLNLS